jgi:hypothetical protein
MSSAIEFSYKYIVAIIFCSLIVGSLFGLGIFVFMLDSKMNLFELNQSCSAKVFGVCEANSGEPYLMCDKITRLWDNQWDCETKSVTNVNHVLISYSENTVKEINNDFNLWCTKSRYEMICQGQSEKGVDYNE